MFRKKRRSITVREFQQIYVEQEIDDIRITKEDIQELKNYIDEQNENEINKHSSISDFMKPIRNGVQFNNYVGVLQTNSGLTIEVLPKIYGTSERLQDQQLVRELFFKMLSTLRGINGKTFRTTNLSCNKNHLLEIFIWMFLNETELILKKGLKSSYCIVENNEKYLKGKLLLSKHLRMNNVNKANFYCEFDQYSINSIENQLIKTTLQYIYNKSNDIDNQRIIRSQLDSLEIVSTTMDPENTYKKITLGRYYKYYEQALIWCRIFLNEKSFTSFKGKSLAYAILFPMEKIFESFIASTIRNANIPAMVSIQDNHHSLFDKTKSTKKEYSLIPDIVLRYNNSTTIIDTKWKVLDKNGPSQSDLYQMYVYNTRYNHNNEDVCKVILLYPYTENYKAKKLISVERNTESIMTNIQLAFIDLFSESLEDDLLEIIRG